jgi:peptidoglycan/LPS O-acetylase OafA/YrhL
MAVIGWLAGAVLIGALALVWQTRDRGPRATRTSLMVLVVAIVAIALAWFVVHGYTG